MSTHNGRLAQLVEQRIYTAKVGGSNPSSPTKIRSVMRKHSGPIFLAAMRDLKGGDSCEFRSEAEEDRVEPRS